jgi:hypothetical protein
MFVFAASNTMSRKSAMVKRHELESQGPSKQFSSWCRIFANLWEQFLSASIP